MAGLDLNNFIWRWCFLHKAPDENHPYNRRTDSGHSPTPSCSYLNINIYENTCLTSCMWKLDMMMSDILQLFDQIQQLKNIYDSLVLIF